MKKVIIVYESKYGNTRLVAEMIAKGLNQFPDVEATVAEVARVDPELTVNYDALLIGSPNHIGGPTRGISKFIGRLGKLDLKHKWMAVFDTYTGNDFQKAMRKMEQQLSRKVHGIILIAPGLSIRVDQTKGPVASGEHPKCEEFGVGFAVQMA
ncbi:MAG: flavodoxin domain-containing protein [Dehalococcoidia bacterium]|nr:flavodoxin domain-containing protein [Dehalococcoidia bacterium]MDD5494191.1 flavodoxin domain-containing protein [Dehalococcoidia bacterium]